MNRHDEADAVMQEAIHLPGTDAQQTHSYGMSLLSAGRKDKAMEVFRFNRQQHPDDRFVTAIGLARGYTALGDKLNAIQNWETALKNVPDNRKALIPTIENALQKLKQGS